MRDDAALETLRLARASYDAAMANLFVNMDILRLTEQILQTNLRNAELNRQSNEALAELIRSIKGAGKEKSTEG